jgi:hypothetical protein
MNLFLALICSKIVLTIVSLKDLSVPLLNSDPDKFSGYFFYDFIG